MNSVNPQSDLPLTESTFLILLSLAYEPKHGYAILKDVTSLSDDRVSLSTGTLYGALKRLLEQGWIERVDDSQVDISGRPRKAYALTPLGRRILAAEIERLRNLVKVARPVLNGEQI
jgi:DNA-binding PadR family transcriptional regulator